MMGFSTFDYRGGGGGSSSTSNLSPLAPPFTIDQSLPKSKPKPNPNLSGHFTEDPYAYSYTSSQGNWVHPHTPTSLSDSFTNPNSKIDFNCGTSLPSATSSYCQSKPYYFGAQSTNTLGTHTSTTSISDSTTSRSPFSYDQQYDTAANTLNQVDPYYHPHYPSAAIHDKHPPSLVINRPSSDVQPMPSGVIPLEVSSQTDYTESLFGLDYNAPWAGGFWNGINDWDQGSRKDSYGSFGWKEKNMTGSSTWKSPLKQGEKASDILPGKSVESLSGSSHIAPRGADLLDAKCSSELEENARVTPFNMRPSIFGSSSVLSEVAYPQEQFPRSVMPSWSERNPNSNSYDRCFSELDSCKTDPTVFYPTPAYSSSALKIRSPANETGLSAFSKHVRPTNVKVIDRPGNIYDNSQNPAGYLPLRDLIHLGVENKEGSGNTNSISNELDRNDHILVNSSPVIKDMPSSCGPITDNSLKHLSKACSEPQVNQCNLSDAFTSTPAVNQEGGAVESSLESFDQFNPPVDSPCWKGAPSSRQSPFAVTEFVNPQVFMQELSGFMDLNRQGPQVFSVNDDASVANSSPKLHVNIVHNENEGVEDGNLPSSSKLKPFQMMQPSLEDNDGASAGQLATECRVVDPGMDVKSARQDGSSSMSSIAKEQAPIPPSSGVTANTKLTEPVGEASDTMENLLLKLDARLLVNAMHNLSELLLSACSNDADALKEQDSEVLQHVIDNLDTLKKVGRTRPTPELQFPPLSSTSYCLRKLTDLRKGIATDKSQVRSVVANDIQSQIDATLFGKKQEVFSDIVSPSDTDSEKDNGITQALEKALKEDFHDEEDSLPQILLYKNLWLEAEAALCSMKYKARFARMKIEMEKSKLQQEKDMAGNPINVENSLKVSREQKSNDILEPMLKESLITNKSTEETSQSSSTSPIEDVEASVIARFKILRCRVDNSSGTSREGELVSQSIGVGTKTQPKEIIDNLELEETMKPWLFIRDRTEDGESLAVGSIPDTMLHGVHHTENEPGLNRDVSRQRVMGKEFQAYVSERPMTNHSYMIPNTIRKQLPAGGYDMDSLSSSDWEHVSYSHGGTDPKA